MAYGRILYLEDEPDWVGHISDLLGRDYDLYCVSSQEEAALLFEEMRMDGRRLDLAIIDISLIQGDPHDKKGLKFVDALERTGVMLGHSIIVLSGNNEVDDNLRVAFRDYDVADVFDKGDFVEQQSALKATVDRIIEELRE